MEPPGRDPTIRVVRGASAREDGEGPPYRPGPGRRSVGQGERDPPERGGETAPIALTAPTAPYGEQPTAPAHGALCGARRERVSDGMVVPDEAQRAGAYLGVGNLRRGHGLDGGDG